MFFGATAIESFIIIIVIFIIVYWCLPRKYSWISFILCTVLLGVLAYHMVPNETDDLARYYQELDFMRERGEAELNRVFEQNLYSFGTCRVAAYYFFFISKFPDNRWLQTITIVIVYGLMFMVIHKAAKRFNVNKLHLFMGVMFFLSTYWFYDTASGIRNGLSFAVAFACAYQHLFERKNIFLCIIGYILAIFTHTSGILPVIIVFAVLFTYKLDSKFINIFFIFMLLIGGYFVQFLAETTDNEWIAAIAEQSSGHGLDTTLESGTMFRVNLTVLIFVLFILLFISYYLKNNAYQEDKASRGFKFLILMLFFIIGTILSSLIFVRFARWILPVTGALLFMTGMQFQSDQINETKKLVSYHLPPGHQIRVKLRPIMMLMFTGYTAVHFYYLCAGSSLYWIHF